MQLVFSTKPYKQIKSTVSPSHTSIPTLTENKNKMQLSNDRSIFVPTPIPSPFQFMIQRIQYENPDCNSCGGK